MPVFPHVFKLELSERSGMGKISNGFKPSRERIIQRFEKVVDI